MFRVNSVADEKNAACKLVKATLLLILSAIFWILKKLVTMQELAATL
jgi:hypothetical protein